MADIPQSLLGVSAYLATALRTLFRIVLPSLAHFPECFLQPFASFPTFSVLPSAGLARLRNNREHCCIIFIVRI